MKSKELGEVQKSLIALLMATYNGEKYLADQLESLLGQTFQEFHLYIQDDCSTDNTWDIINAYAAQYPEHISCVRNRRNSGSAKHNFLQMMLHHRDKYVMLCDQDDVWMPDKIEKTLAEMRRQEKKWGKETPLLVHTDLRVVDRNLRTIAPSFCHFVNANYDRNAFHYELPQNTITGCTAMYNLALAKLLVRQPDFCVMHDWWLALVASAFGHIGVLPESTVLYRQHERNSIGAKPNRSLKYLLNRLLCFESYRSAMEESYLQAKSFCETYQPFLSDEVYHIAKVYSEIPQKSKLKKWQDVCRFQFYKYGVIRKSAQFIFI